jgi:hypothetical protein
MSEADTEYAWALYEQARTRKSANSPWPNAADLTSYLASEKVDALHARILRTIWSDPVFTVEGFGEAADRAPFVEEFHQWKVEEERLQKVLDKLMLCALVEPRGLLEVAEGTEMRVSRKTITAKIQTDPASGGLVFGEDGKPLLERDPQTGDFVEAGPQDIGATTVIDQTDRVRTGPVYRVLPYRDSIILPGHAREEAEIWAYGKRFWRRYVEIQRLAGTLYDQDAVDRMSKNDDRITNESLARSGTAITPSDEVAQKELWELLVLLDLELLFSRRGLPVPRALKGQGERWFLVTLHPPSTQVLRLQYDDLERSRFVPVILFPRPDRCTEGFSFVGHKLLTIVEEHTAVRNMRADREALVNSAPLKRRVGALWDPFEQPFGPGAVIDVLAMDEVEALVIPPITPSLIEWEQNTERTAERVSGINDISSGQIASQSRTLGEIQMATTSSEIRMDLIRQRLNEPLEDLAQIRHAIWKRTLAARPDGEAAPVTLVQNLEGRGVSIDKWLPDQKITAALLDGAFKFKPHGSVETADINKQQQNLVQFLQFLPVFLQMFPAMAAQFQQPAAARSFLRWVLHAFRVPNINTILGSPAQDLQQTQQALLAPMLAMLQGGGVGPGMPLAGTEGPLGLPPGGPPPGMGVPGPPGGPPSMPPPMMPGMPPRGVM